MTPNRLLVLVPVAALALAGCGGGGGSKKSASTTTAAPAKTATSAPPVSAPGGAVPVANATDLAHKPELATPKGKPPDHLVKKDLVIGHGPSAKPGDLVTVQYVGISWSTGKQFDASWDRGQPFTFPLGRGQVIQGWDQGVPGMKVGGRRELVIPPSLGYGAQGAGADIKPNETLVFVVDLKRIG